MEAHLNINGSSWFFNMLIFLPKHNSWPRYSFPVLFFNFHGAAGAPYRTLLTLFRHKQKEILVEPVYLSWILIWYIVYEQQTAVVWSYIFNKIYIGLHMTSKSNLKLFTPYIKKISDRQWPNSFKYTMQILTHLFLCYDTYKSWCNTLIQVWYIYKLVFCRRIFVSNITRKSDSHKQNS